MRLTRRLIGLAGAIVSIGLLTAACSGTTNGIDAAGTPIPTSSASATQAPSSTPTAEPSVAPDAKLAACPTVKPAKPVDNGMPTTDLPCLGPGPNVDLASLQGKPTVVNVWASWCGPCRQEAAALQGAHAQLGSKVAFMGVDILDDPKSAQLFLEAFKVTYPSAFDHKAVVRAPLQVLGPPVTYFVSPDGVILLRINGGMGSTKQVLDAVHQAFGISP